MPKYILIGFAIPAILFLTMHYWTKFNDKTKNKIITSIFGIIAITFVALITLLIF